MEQLLTIKIAQPSFDWPIWLKFCLSMRLIQNFAPALWKYDLESKFRQRAFDRVRPYDKLNLFRNNTDSICTSVNPCVLLLWGFWNGISFFVVPDKRFRFATFLRSLRYYEVSVRPAPFSTFSNDETTSIGLQPRYYGRGYFGSLIKGIIPVVYAPGAPTPWGQGRPQNQKCFYSCLEHPWQVWKESTEPFRKSTLQLTALYI